MEDIDKNLLIEAIKSARSPKMALNGTKLLCGSGFVFSDIFKECFEIAWQDATRRNRAIEWSKGKRADELWKPRSHLDSLQLQEIANRMISTKRYKELGKVLSELDEEGIRFIFNAIRNARTEQT